MNSDVDFVLFIAKSLVTHPDDVLVERIVDERGVLLVLRVNQEDMGKVIGKSGATAIAMRHLLHVYGMKNQARVSLKIFDPRRESNQPQKMDIGALDTIEI